MTEVLLRIADTQFWVLADTVKETIISTYKKANVEADIAAIIETLKRYPDPTTEEYAYGVLHQLVQAAKLTADEKAYGKALLERMWEAYTFAPATSDVFNLRARLEQLQTLLAKMV